MAQLEAPSYRSFARETISTRLWILYLARLVLFAGLVCYMPFFQTEVTDFFVKRHTDKHLDCNNPPKGPPKGIHIPPGGFQGFPPVNGSAGGFGFPFSNSSYAEIMEEMKKKHHGPPKPCIKAHTDVAIWTTGRILVTSFTLSLFLNPVLGKWSDMYGRKPFLVIGTLTNIIQPGFLILYTIFHFPIYWFYVVSVVAVAFNNQSIVFAYISDVIEPQNRILAFGLNMLLLCIGIMIAMSLKIIGAVTTLQSASIASAGFVLLSAAIVTFAVPESLTPDLMQKARESVAERRRGEKKRWEKLHFCWDTFKDSMKIVFRNRLFRRLTAIMFIVAIIAEEYIEFKVQYLQEVLRFGTDEQATMLMINGVSGFLLLTVGLWLAKPVMNLTEKQILLISMVLLTASFGILAAAEAAWMAYLSTALVMSWVLLSLSISVLKSIYVAAEEQGATQGALTAVFTTGQALGPILFVCFFIAFRQGSVYIPGAPFYFAFFLGLVGIYLVATLKVPKETGPAAIIIEEQKEETVPLIGQSGE